MTRHKRGIPREQTSLLPARIEDYVSADHPVRVIDAFVDSLDLISLGFEHALAADTGRPPYHPADLLKLFVYGYMNRLRATRRLEVEACRNLELMWLIGQLRPDFKTLSLFRRANAQAIGQTCRSFTDFCRKQGLFAAELVAIDGSKFQAVASRKRVWTAQQLAKAQTQIDERIAMYLKELEQSESEHNNRASPERVQAALDELRGRKAQLDAVAHELDSSGQSQLVQGEPEARLMRSPHGHTVSYNVQIAVDSAHKLIVAHEVTNEGNDHRQLYPMASAAKQSLQVDKLNVVADTGYTNGEHAARCEANGITPVVPMMAVSNTHGDYFSKEKFVYEHGTDTYRCPAGQALARIKTDARSRDYVYGTRACDACELRPQCTGARRRTINRDFNATHAEAAAQRAEQQPRMMLVRKSVAEHPFGNIKWMMGAPRFLLRSLAGARIEMNLAITAYNLKRVIQILGVQQLLAEIRPA